MKIGIDCDEVLVKFVEVFLEFCKKKEIDGLKYEQITNYHFHELLGLTKEELFGLFDEFYLSDMFENLEFIDNAKESLTYLSKENEIYIITARPVFTKQKTINFFEKHLPEIILNIIHTSETGIKKTKAEICQELGVEVFIEDRGDYALKCAREGIKSFLLDKPWNRSIEHPNLYRVCSWDEIIDKLNKRSDLD